MIIRNINNKNRNTIIALWWNGTAGGNSDSRCPERYKSRKPWLIFHPFPPCWNLHWQLQSVVHTYTQLNVGRITHLTHPGDDNYTTDYIKMYRDKVTNHIKLERGQWAFRVKKRVWIWFTIFGQWGELSKNVFWQVVLLVALWQAQVIKSGQRFFCYT